MAIVKHFLVEYPCIAVIVGSLLWFLVGVQIVRNEEAKAGLRWQIIGMTIAFAVGIGAIVTSQWRLALCSGLVFLGELLMYRRMTQTDRQLPL